MKISSLSVAGFRCFGPIAQTISLDNLTAFIGPNASGKTSAMMALARLFGETSNQRRITPSDFHLPPGENLKANKQRNLFIECCLTFPELEKPDTVQADTIPECFNQMIVDRPGGKPFCRVRLDATWVDDGSALGDVEQSLSWVLTDSQDPKDITDANLHKVQPGDRARIRVIYVPAMRDPDQQIRGTTASSLATLLSAVEWGDATQVMKDQLEALRSQLASLKGVETLNTHVQKSWSDFYRGRVAKSVSFQAMEEDPVQLIKALNAAFRPAEDGRTISASELSDGLRSLFSLSLSISLFEVEQSISRGAAEAGYCSDLVERLPLLTIFAVEEPENHLSPHYLGHVVKKLLDISGHSCTQIVTSSHSPAILGRVEPDNIRYFLGNDQTNCTSVSSLPLPQDPDDESFKYVREAVRGYPELYFANLVILGEGPSEEIVLKHIFETSGLPLDTHFMSIVPLGGRHVNHFWRLLKGLKIPHLTLLDLDREKDGAGWGRIQYIRDQLVRQHGETSEQIKFTDSNGAHCSLADVAYENLSANDVMDQAAMNSWIGFFQDRFDVYFSVPLDLDLCLLEAFTDVYKGLVIPPAQGPRLPKQDTPEYEAAIDKRVKRVLASNIVNPPNTIGSTYTPEQRELFPWYQYLFLDGSKPVSHLRAMIQIEDAVLTSKLPAPLTSLVARAKTLVATLPEEIPNA